jgi:hypothetical protein
MHEQLPSDVIATDHRLETAVNRSSEALAKHRWHWTRDESNPARVSMREYAKAINRGYKTVHSYAKGYELWSDPKAGITITEAVIRADMSAEREEIVRAVAHVNDVEFITATRLYHEDIKDVKAELARYEEDHPEATPEEKSRMRVKLAHTAKDLRRMRKHFRESIDREQQIRRFAPETHLDIGADLVNAKNSLSEALRKARDVDPAMMDAEDPALLESLRQWCGDVITMAKMVKQALGGVVERDWDQELLSLRKE